MLWSQEERDGDMECDTLLPHHMSNGHLLTYHCSTRYTHHHTATPPGTHTTTLLSAANHRLPLGVRGRGLSGENQDK